MDFNNIKKYSSAVFVIMMCVVFMILSGCQKTRLEIIPAEKDSLKTGHDSSLVENLMKTEIEDTLRMPDIHP